MIDKDILLVGDFNSKNSDWFCGDNTNSNGLHLKELMDRLDMYQLCDEATHLNCALVSETWALPMSHICSKAGRQFLHR